jgi:hypothetical protein
LLHGFNGKDFCTEFNYSYLDSCTAKMVEGDMLRERERERERKIERNLNSCTLKVVEGL